ncbi:hypothetical protein HA402_000449 [Bradysia odoriphaga]|nr:hypothetical protein HA402_000449 [Bradysia odoriphaga]
MGSIIQMMFVELTLLFVILHHRTDGNPTKFVYVDYLHCQFSKKFLVNASCKLSFINRTQKAVTLKFVSITAAVTEEMIHFQLHYRYRTGWRIFLINFKDNYCDYVTKGNPKATAMNLLIPTITKYSNVNLTCPFIGPFSIIKMPANGAMFNHPFIPVGKYYLNVTMTFMEELILSMQFYFTIPEGRSIENDGLGR